jgi:hypothetical protein
MAGCAWVPTFEPFLAKCAAVRRLRVIEGMMVRGIGIDRDRSMQGLIREETEGHFKKDGNICLPCQTMACDVEEPMALVERIESRQLGRRGSGPTAEVSLRREPTLHE